MPDPGDGDSVAAITPVNPALDTNYMSRKEALAMLKVIQDSMARIKDENEKLRQKPPKPEPINFPDEPTEPYQHAIRWMWENPNPPSQMRCLGYIVTGGGAPKLRMNATAHACVVNSIKAYRENRLEEAINWLRAGQCHNDLAQQQILEAGQTAAQWALQKYGKDVPE